MNLTVNQLLNIVGRLDDSPGFDTPRERFRRFLGERVTDAQSARIVIQECRQMSGEQNHRASGTRWFSQANCLVSTRPSTRISMSPAQLRLPASGKRAAAFASR
jgi:hypothetical protein